MTLSSFSFIYLSFYYVAVILAYLRARSGKAPKARNSLAAMIIGAVGTLLIYGSSLLAPGGTVPLVLVAALALFPVFLLGLGNLVGLALVAMRPRKPLQFMLGLCAFGVPLLVAILFIMDPAQMRTKAQGALSDPQSETALVMRVHVASHTHVM